MQLDYKKYAETSREICADSCVLLKNDNVLPIKKDEKISIFGRAQMELYYCGTGSGGMVNLPYVTQLNDTLSKKRDVNQDLVEHYRNYINENPFDKGVGWAQEPWSQEELLLDDSTVKSARAVSDVALIVIGRSAGEDKDAAALEGSYYLTETEKANMKLICSHFDKVAVLLNVGNIIDTDYSNCGDPKAIIYTWHGGCESGNGYTDVICGDVNPSGSLTDTIGKELKTNSSNANFGGENENLYQEDIFVGYRYTETFAPETVLYPFGFGLSYTKFKITLEAFNVKENDVTLSVSVENIGDVDGKKSVQIYLEAPNGKLGKASRVLVGFSKTKVLKPNEKVTVNISIKDWYFASYDDSKFCFVLEQGEYKFLAGFDVRDCQTVGSYTLENDVIIEQCTQSLAPTKSFDRIVAVEKNGQRVAEYKPVTLRGYDIAKRIADNEQEAPPKTENGYKFTQVKEGKITAYELACELTDLDLVHMSRGEGMCSPKVTSGTAGCFGGVTKNLQAKEIPIACCADGPSGIRMDSGTMAFSIPNGTAIASTFDIDLTKKLFEFLGLELAINKIDTILGPGMNIHRNPLCGRNFEYFSEDPFLTGKIAVAQLQGLHMSGVTGTIKHFIANNQETHRRLVDTVASERAIREIYLRGYELAVKEGQAHSIMTAYNPVNGIHAASSYDLTTQVLRTEWGYKGLVMTDWWAQCNVEGEKGIASNTTAMIIAQNELYMVNANAEENSNKDNSETSLAAGKLSRYVLVRNATNVIETLAKMHCSKSNGDEITVVNRPVEQGKTHVEIGTFDITSEEMELDFSKVDTKRGNANHYTFHITKPGGYKVEFDLEAEAVELAQVPMTITANGNHVKTITLKGQTRKTDDVVFEVLTNVNTYFDLYFGESGMKIHSMKISRVENYGIVTCPINLD